MILWDSQDSLWLLTPEEFETLPDGAKMTSIMKENVVKGVDYIDGDTRFGHWLSRKKSERKQLRVAQNDWLVRHMGLAFANPEAAYPWLNFIVVDEAKYMFTLLRLG